VSRIRPPKLSEVDLKMVDAGLDIIKYVTTQPPDPANFNFLWTSAAVVPCSPRARASLSKTTAFGAGLSSVESITTAIGEALELCAAGQCSDNDLSYSSTASLKEDFLDPRQLGLYSREQYRKSDFPFDRFHSRCRIAWTRGRWLDSGGEVWLPAFLTYFGADVSLDQNFAQVTTSGLATGTSVKDAAMRAACELVERDAFMMTWLAQLPAIRLVLDPALDPPTRSIVNEFEKREVEMRLYLLNTGIDIPVVLCLIKGDGENWPGATVGLGAHANPVVATRKAILEQVMVGPPLRREMLAGKRRIPTRTNQIKTPLDHALYYLPKGRARAFDFLDSRKHNTVSLSDLRRPKRISLDFYLKKLQAAEVRVAIKNLTPPDVAAETPFRVVRALGTNLQAIHFGFGLTRAATRRLQRLAKNGLNRRPHPLG
jgi:ribosomal protein S12 methylthiotransferase accessory factor